VRVVKLGGSLATWSDLPACLENLAGLNCVIVPGGGPFADEVRQAQQAWRFDERTAHDMALLAMAQFGRMLAGLEPRLATGRTAAGLQRLIAESRSAVWLPDPAEADLQALPPSWDTTSDSLAAWLAECLGATELVLLKSARPPGGACTLSDLAAAGLLDPAFEAFTAGAAYAVWIAHRDHHTALRSALSETSSLRRLAGPAPR